MRSLGWALIQYDRCSYLKKKKRLGHSQAQRKDHVRTQAEEGHLKA